MKRIDHVIIAVSNLDGATGRLKQRFGLNAIGDGTHPFGTANRTVPLKPPQYIELLSVANYEVASAAVFGKLLIERLKDGDCLLGWAVRVDEIEAEGARLRRPLIPGEWHGPDGSIGRWLNIFPDIEDFESLPFFIRYEGENSDLRDEGYAEAASPAQPADIVRLELGGNKEKIVDWLGDDSLPLRFVDGAPGLQAVVLNSPCGEIVIRNKDLASAAASA